MRKLLIAAFAACLGFVSSSANAGFQYGFSAVTNNRAANVAVGVNQLKVDVIDVGMNRVKFEFSNTGSNNGSITDIYFQDSPNLFSTVSSIQNQTGVFFRNGANPATLTSGANVGFVTDTALNTESSSISYGVGKGEKVGITLNLTSGKMFGDVINAIATSSLRMGTQMMGFTLMGSESFVNSTTNTSPVPVTPEPSALALGGLACIGLMWRRCKQIPVCN